MLRIAFSEMEATIFRAFSKAGLPESIASICAHTHTTSSCDGVFSHGLNRVERFVDYLEKGWINPTGKAHRVSAMGNWEIYDGEMGPGITNAIFAMDRAIELAKQHGMGMISVRNTTHWMRGGSYGWQAADNGVLAICFTNTETCMPPWGGKTGAIGNNPFIMAVPRDSGEHVVLDMAMSQYSYGKLQVKRLANQQLPYAGGFTTAGELTCDPGSIEASRRILPTGFWKGSGMAILIDLLASILSGGNHTAAIDRIDKGSCASCCQIFMAFDPLKLNSASFVEHAIADTIRQVKSALPAEAIDAIVYPGEQSLNNRKINLEKGIPVDEGVWNKVMELANR